MRKLSSLSSIGLLAVAVPAAATSVSVSFVQPERYTDASYSHPYATEKDRAEVQRDIAQHFQRLAERRLPANEELRIEVLDVDLAGWFEPFRFRTAADVRIIRDIAWPRMKLRYTLLRDGQPLASGEEQLVDMNYLMNSNVYSGSDRLRYEKAMMDDWFEKRFSAH
ncbi:DUF3016 domain-containing protein [Variovorax humicola]|uniref:DUF3016 domain-containing protein n=1 Tax=Variovorax humicola TaxID=1769758 RepID=A0ABU8WBD4_9BURK